MYTELGVSNVSEESTEVSITNEMVQWWWMNRKNVLKISNRIISWFGQS